MRDSFDKMNVNKVRWYLFYIFPPVFYAILIFLLSSISHYPEEISVLFSFDKIIHLIEYYIFGYLLLRVFVTSPRVILFRYHIIFTLLIGVLYGLGDEWHQSFISGRCASVYDLIFDCFGVVLAVLTYRLVRYNLPVVQRIETKIEKTSTYE